MTTDSTKYAVMLCQSVRRWAEKKSREVMECFVEVTRANIRTRLIFTQVRQCTCKNKIKYTALAFKLVPAQTPEYTSSIR